MAQPMTREEARQLSQFATTDPDKIEVVVDCVPTLVEDYIALLDEVERLREAAEVALPLLRGRSCWHDDPEEPDCCEHGLVAEHLSVALGNEPLPMYTAYLASDAAGSTEAVDAVED